MQAARLLRRIGSKISRRSYASHEVHPKTTMNDLPSPKGDWQTNYDQNQKKHNRDLLIGIVTLGATLAFGQYYGFHEFYNNLPELPATPPNYREE